LGLNRRQLIIEPGFLQACQFGVFDVFDVTAPDPPVTKTLLIGFFPLATHAKLTPALQQLRNLAGKMLRAENNSRAPQCRAIRSRV
jgi:hypothetical protein